MRTPRECAAYMRERYGKNAEIHCMYAIMNNYDNSYAKKYWTDVRTELDILSKRDYVGREDGEKREGKPDAG